jgi:hypothetical protein
MAEALACQVFKESAELYLLLVQVNRVNLYATQRSARPQQAIYVQRWRTSTLGNHEYCWGDCNNHGIKMVIELDRSVYQPETTLQLLRKPFSQHPSVEPNASGPRLRGLKCCQSWSTSWRRPEAGGGADIAEPSGVRLLDLRDA